MRRRRSHRGGGLIARTTIKQLKQRRVGEQIRDAREAAELSQRDLAQRMGTSQAAIARLEAGGVGATLTTLQRAASALHLNITLELRAAS